MSKDSQSAVRKATPGNLLRKTVGPVVLLSLVVAIIIIGVLKFTHPANDVQASSITSRITEATGDAIKSALDSVPVFPRLREPLNVLVMGVDWNGKDSERYTGTRSDTMMLVSFDPESKRVSIISIPRDSRVEVRGRSYKINQAHALGGPRMAMDVVSANFNVPVEHYVIVDTAGLRKIFELLGPVEVCVEKEMHYHDHTGGLSIDLMPGKQLLNAEQLEGYVRFRHDARADVGRMERQQWLLRQAAQKLKEPAVLMSAPKMLQIGYESIKTDLSLEQVTAVLSFVKDLSAEEVVTATLPGQGETIDGVNYYVLNSDGTAEIFNRLCNNNQVEESQSEYLPFDKARIRLSIKYPPETEAFAKDIEHILSEKGWRVRHLIASSEEECNHAQLAVNSPRVGGQVVSMLRQDLPAVSKWPATMNYGPFGGDLILVLPVDRGLSSWQSKYKAQLEERFSPPMSQ
ncbi:MAG: LCP family protein [Cyanobacteria bacterium]|nr:LCP family protein [Cyanobacteriota bacterium]